MKRKRDSGFWIRTVLWLTSIAIVAIPLKQLKQSHGSAAYFFAGLAIILLFFATGTLISRWLNNRNLT